MDAPDQAIAAIVADAVPMARPKSSLDLQPSQTGQSSSTPAAENRDGSGNGDVTPESPQERERRLAFLPLTDLGNAERFCERNRDRLMWCGVIGWFWWDGKRWARKGADERVRLATHVTVRAIQGEANALALDGHEHDPKLGEGPTAEYLSDRLRRWGRTSESNAKLNALAEQASAFLAVLPSELDADLWLINVGNGTLRIDKSIDGYVVFAPHNPRDKVTKLAPVDFDPDAVAPRFLQFISEIQPSAGPRRTLSQWKGYSLTGDTGEQKLAVLWGKGQNGKSVFEEATAFVAGDYCATTPIETFLAEGRGRNAGQATPELAVLPGVRMLRTSEPRKGATLDEALVKLMTGNEEIKARHLNEGYFGFHPQFKLTISGNYRPKIVGADDGIWRRVVLIPFPVRIANEHKDMALGRKLRSEAPGILNWMLDGLRDYLDNGLQIGEEVESATAEYRRDSDQLGRFLEACTVIEAGARVQSSVLHAVFNAWSRANLATEWKGRGFSDAMTERGFKKTRSSVWFFIDLRLTKSVDDFVDVDGKPWTDNPHNSGRVGRVGGGFDG